MKTLQLLGLKYRSGLVFIGKRSHCNVKMKQKDFFNDNKFKLNFEVYIFLVAKLLYNSECPYVCPSVRLSVRN